MVGYLEIVELLGDLLHPATVDQLVDVEGGAAMGTLGSLLRQPTPKIIQLSFLEETARECQVNEYLNYVIAWVFLRRQIRGSNLKISVITT